MKGPARAVLPGGLLVALVLDATWGEPPPRLHPVVWAGHFLSRAQTVVPSSPPGRAGVLGGMAWAGGALVSVGAATALSRCSRRLPAPIAALVTGTALWPLLSGRMLLAEVAGVERALATGVPEGRAALSRLVSRDTSSLTATEVRSAAIESLAENLSDAYVATLFWMALTGLPGAALHRYANTADAMWGYRTARWEHAGKVTARVDDLLNLAPARVTAVLLAGVRPSLLWRARREARRTPSPNGGWPMGTLALRLDVRLPKAGAYVLHPAGRDPTADDLAAALATARRAAVAAAVAACTAMTMAALFNTALFTPSPPEGAS